MSAGVRKSEPQDGQQAPQQNAVVVPIAFDLRKGQFHHFQKYPIRGNVYYREARKVIMKRLTG